MFELVFKCSKKNEDFIVSLTVFGRFSLDPRRIGTSINFGGISAFLYEFRIVAIMIFL